MTEKKSLVEYQNEINELIYNESLQEEEQTNYLSIVLKDKHYLINLVDIKETSTLPSISKIGRVNSWFLGISNFRGQVNPVIDMTFIFTGKNSNYNESYALLANPKFGTNCAMLWDGVNKLITQQGLVKKENVNLNELKWIKEVWIDEKNIEWHEINVEQLMNCSDIFNIYKENK